MLQQTQVATVIPYFNRWMTRFPDIHSLAVAETSDLLSLWQGLGYYRRARLLQEGARHIVANGAPEATAEAWRAVPGIGPYTAGAVTSIAFGSPEPLVDGNVERVYSRLNADAATGTALTRHAWSWAAANLDPKRPGNWNQALMELGATICTPKNPRCSECPLSTECEAFATDTPTAFPSPKAKPTTLQLSHTTVIPCFQERFGVTQIPKGEWWAEMWQFPKVIDEGLVCEIGSNTRYLGTILHTVTRHKIRLAVYVRNYSAMIPDLRWVTQSELKELAMPSPQRKAFDLLTKSEPRLGL